MRFFICVIVLLLNFSVYAAPNFPFPQNVNYPFGIKPASIKAERIQTTYEAFVKRFYEENQDKSMARIKWDTPSQTVSEGIGYGMLIMVYMDNATNSTREKFDRLWKYYNSFLNSNGLMHWKIDGFTGIVGTNAASDAEFDVAMALVQAYKQWNDQKYLDDARALIDKIWKYEINANGYVKPGDTWDSKKNPSYFSTAAFESFKNAGSQDWNRVISTSYDLIKKVRNPTSGLVPDWCQENGGSTGDVYYYDAARTPWRIAWGYLWYGHNDAKNICSTIASWITSSSNGNPAKVGDQYTLDGNKTSSELTSTFLGGFACASMVDAVHQNWLDKAYKVQDSLIEVDEKYFGSSLKMIYLLLLSGNMPDLWNPPAPATFTVIAQTNPAGSGTITVTPKAERYKQGDTVTIRAIANTPFTFAQWNGDTVSTDSVITIVVTKNVSVTAQFDKVAVKHLWSDATPELSLTPVAMDGRKLRYSVPRAGKVTIEVYSLQGKLIVRPVQCYQHNGSHTFILPASIANGLFLVALHTASGSLHSTISIHQ